MRLAIPACLLILLFSSPLRAEEPSPPSVTSVTLGAQPGDWAEWSVRIRNPLGTLAHVPINQTARLPDSFVVRLQVEGDAGVTLHVGMQVRAGKDLLLSETLTWQKTVASLDALMESVTGTEVRETKVTCAGRVWLATTYGQFRDGAQAMSGKSATFVVAEAFSFRLLSCITQSVEIRLEGCSVRTDAPGGASKPSSPKAETPERTP